MTTFEQFQILSNIFVSSFLVCLCLSLSQIAFLLHHLYSAPTQPKRQWVE